ncbi:MAG: hypothetical protein ACLRQF_18490, partial [Thomasclavelia ramosa]
KSILDKSSDEIARLFKKPGVHKRAAYEYLLDKYGEDNIGTYNNFKYYTWKRDMKPQKLSCLMLDMKQNQGNNCR